MIVRPPRKRDLALIEYVISSKNGRSAKEVAEFLGVKPDWAWYRLNLLKGDKWIAPNKTCGPGTRWFEYEVGFDLCQSFVPTRPYKDRKKPNRNL